ncbi:universal stress protein [Fibrisoma montanum]|uniref:Universal stress protein n=1 Tax=Fibrisoma montanum TaxID=2305895 RepID=A0A418LWV8_9BACT|nr:universal stress protein [Fibrisoma montanum]RIV17711.1 universal stress protein [Fibrisoma montanum]
MKRILVPTDLSELANRALPVAVRLARQYDADIFLVHYLPFAIVDPGLTEAPTAITTYLNDREEEVEAELTQLARHPDFQGVTIHPVVKRSDRGLFGMLIDQPADLIVMASHGSSGLEEWLFGSNAEHIVQQAHCPVLIIKEQSGPFDPTNAICAIDADDRLKSHPTWPFHLSDGVRQFVYVMTPTDGRVTDGIRQWMAEFAATKQITDYDLTIFADSNVPDGIIHFAESRGADLILLFTHQKSGLLHLVSGSVAEDVVNHATIPVLVMPVA